MDENISIHICGEPCAGEMVKLQFFLFFLCDVQYSCAAKECQVPNETEMHGFTLRTHAFSLESVCRRGQNASAGKVLSPNSSDAELKLRSSIIHYYTVKVSGISEARLLFIWTRSNSENTTRHVFLWPFVHFGSTQ